MSSPAQDRDRRMLTAIAGALRDASTRAAVESRAAALPMMLMRHGLAATSVYMASKDGDDLTLWNAVMAGLVAVMPEAPTSPRAVLDLSLENYLLASELMIASAALTAQWARVPDPKKELSEGASS